MRHFEEASRVRPEDYQAAMLDLAAVRRRWAGTRKRDAALRRGLQVVERHLELNPDDARALYLGAIALAQLGERERALEWADRALAIDPEDSGVLYNVACVQALCGKRERGPRAASRRRSRTASATGNGSRTTPTWSRCGPIPVPGPAEAALAGTPRRGRVTKKAKTTAHQETGHANA